MLPTYTEENYLKTLLKLTLESKRAEAGTNELATHLMVKPATVSDMLKKLKEKQLVDYEKYGKITLTDEGKKIGIEIIRRHRLWETFLYEKLEFTWDEVHEVAEQLEHIHSAKLVDKLDKFLNYPAFDPHGDPIPNVHGELNIQFKKTLFEVGIGESCKMVSVKDNSSTFLQYVVKLGLGLHQNIQVISKLDYDSSMVIEVDGIQSAVSQKFAENVFVV